MGWKGPLEVTQSNCPAMSRDFSHPQNISSRAWTAFDVTNLQKHLDAGTAKLAGTSQIKEESLVKFKPF